jgi:predicted RNA-binding Zn-ribbon protein involved in translation (DUF1610 family)
MKPYYGAINSENQWWDGKDWRRLERNPKTGHYSISTEHMLMQLEQLKMHDAANCHVNGVFRCPRCRKQHNTPDNFDYLCDGCEAVLWDHPKTPLDVLLGLANWHSKKQAYYEIKARFEERDRLQENPGAEFTDD